MNSAAKAGVEHGAVEVEGVAQGQHEAGDAVLHPELLQLLHQLGVGRFAAGGGEAEQHGAAHQLEQAEHVAAEHQVTGTDEHQPQHGQGDVEAGQQLAEHTSMPRPWVVMMPATAPKTPSGAKRIT
jgi:hypothetical protein